MDGRKYIGIDFGADGKAHVVVLARGEHGMTVIDDFDFTPTAMEEKNIRAVLKHAGYAKSMIITEEGAIYVRTKQKPRAGRKRFAFGGFVQRVCESVRAIYLRLRARNERGF